MGQLTVTVGPVTGTKTFNDTTGTVILDDYIAAYDGPVDGTNQQKLDWIVNHLANHVKAVHVGYKRRTASEQAADQAENTAEDWN